MHRSMLAMLGLIAALALFACSKQTPEPATTDDQPVATGGAAEQAPPPTEPAVVEPAPAEPAPAEPAEPEQAEPAKPSAPDPASGAGKPKPTESKQRPSPDTAAPADPPPSGNSGDKLPAQTEACTGDGKCAAGLTCKSYYGIAGPRGPKFTSCEIPCSGKAASCPKGQNCTTIADGPGQVCRP